MSISEINEIKTATNYVIENKNNNYVKNEIINLFSNSQFNNGGSTSANIIEKEVNTLQNYITGKNSEYKKKTAELNIAQNELKTLNKKLENEILEVTKQANNEETEQRNQIQKAINEVNQMYMNGDIEKGEMSSRLVGKISKYASLSSGVTTKLSGLNGTKSRISALTSRIATIIDTANNIESELNTATGTLSVMQNLMDKMVINGSVSTDESNTSGAMGFVYDNKNYNFIIDKNSDGKVNGDSEFLGVDGGFEALINMDKNNDNTISFDELKSNNMYVLMTDNKTGSSKFMSLLESGVTSIDLSTITSENFNNLEEPEVQNIFTVNTAFGASVQGYENASVKGYDNTDMIVGVDEYVIKQAKNIFAKGASLSDEGLEDNIINAATKIKAAEMDVKKISNEMSSNNSTASSHLTNAERPETEKEKEGREAEEAKKAEENKKAQEQKEAEEKAKAEEEKKAKEAEEKAKAEEEKKSKKAEEKAKAEEEKKTKEAEEKLAQ